MNTATDTWRAVVNAVGSHAPANTSDAEIQAAARNFAGFCRLALEIRQNKGQNSAHDNS